MGHSQTPRPIRIYLMPEYSSSSLWMLAEDSEDGRTGGMVPLQGLPLTEETKRALEAWSGRLYDWLAADSGEGPPFDDDAFEAEGLRLWRVLREELPPRFEVGMAEFHTGTKTINWGPPPASSLR